MAFTRPFLKWAGNKYRILDTIEQSLPKTAERLVEPFAGSAAVSLNLIYPSHLVAEKNPDLVHLFKSIKKEGQSFIEYARGFFTESNRTADNYYSLREQFNQSDSPRLRAALFLYLNRHGFNGLCRYNSSGIFNVPIGKYDKVYFPEKELQHFHQRAKRMRFTCQDFVKTMKKAREGDVIYCDPPYVPLSNSSDFTNYSPNGFNEADQIKLAELAHDCQQRGIPVLISNHATDFTRELYQAAQCQEFPVDRMISRDAASRKPVQEILALFR